MPMETNMSVIGKKLNTMFQTINTNVQEWAFTYMPMETNTLENGKMVKGTAMESIHILMERLRKEFGEKIN